MGKKFATLQEAVLHINSGRGIKATITLGTFVAGTPIKGTGASIQSGYMYFTPIATGTQVGVSLGQIESAVYTKDDLLREVLGLEEQMADVKSRLAYINEVRTEDFDENEFKVWTTLQLIKDTKLSDIDKSKLIAKLISR